MSNPRKFAKILSKEKQVELLFTCFKTAMFASASALCIPFFNGSLMFSLKNIGIFLIFLATFHLSWLIGGYLDEIIEKKSKK